VEALAASVGGGGVRGAAHERRRPPPPPPTPPASTPLQLCAAGGRPPGGPPASQLDDGGDGVQVEGEAPTLALRARLELPPQPPRNQLHLPAPVFFSLCARVWGERRAARQSARWAAAAWERASGDQGCTVQGVGGRRGQAAAMRGGGAGRAPDARTRAHRSLLLMLSGRPPRYAAPTAAAISFLGCRVLRDTESWGCRGPRNGRPSSAVSDAATDPSRAVRSRCSQTRFSLACSHVSAWICRAAARAGGVGDEEGAREGGEGGA